jgi:hypothetical protein
MNRDVAYEPRDVPPRIVLLLAAMVAGAVLVASVALFYAYPQARPAAPRALGELPPEPRLQIDERTDMAALRAQQLQRLQSWGWIDRAHGVAHQPIDQAMQRVAREGIDLWPAR